MKTTLCTLFNVNYLDKGLVLYESLEAVAKDFELYVLAMDDRCHEILYDMKKPHLIPIKLSDFENEELLKAKSDRTFGEYCWTCSSALIIYILKTYNPDNCTYVDADMCFYSDPGVLIDEMYQNDASVLVVGHRFLKPLEKSLIYDYGRYCVEFNTFKNDEDGNKLLKIWQNQCLECCTHLKGVYCGDQKYLDDWCEDYKFVHETTNLGAGLAPWNISQYSLVSSDDGRIVVKCHGHEFDLIFYHFEQITYITDKSANINVYNFWGVSRKLVNCLYKDYLKRLDCQKRILSEKYGFAYLMKSHPGVKVGKQTLLDKIRNSIRRITSFGGVNFFIFNRIPLEIYKSRNIIHWE